MATESWTDGAGDTPCVQVWRIENFVPQIWDRFELADKSSRRSLRLYTGDSFVVLATTGATPPTFDIHFWLGSESTKDEVGAAALKALELSDNLPNTGSLHREIQQHESALFRSYFKGGIIYLEGGCASGASQNDDGKRLLHVKGAKRVRLSQVPMAVSSLNDGDVFILDTGTHIGVWCGSGSNPQERAKGEQFAHALNKEERMMKSAVEVIEQGQEPEAFWLALGGQAAVMTAEEYAVDDEQFVRQLESRTQLYVLNSDGATKVDNEGPLTNALLLPQGVFLLDCGTELFVWVGSESGTEDRQAWLSGAAAFLESQGRPAHTSISMVVEGN